MTPEIFWRWLGGTRFTMTVGAGIVDTGLVLLDKLTGDQYVTLTLATVAVFIGAAAYSRAQEVKSASPN